MNSEKRGRAIILNNKEFVCDKKTRTGTDVDASNVCARFKHLGFEVVRHNNKTGEQMKETITDVSALDFSSCDCLVCVILSYGEEGLIYGTEGPVQIKDFVDPFKRNKSLAGKPKLFFTNGAGMAAEYVNGVLFRRVETHIIPREADFLIAYSTVPGNLSWEGQG
ncbi:caspase-3-like [Haliotis rubra]|uniref:caspase-3-like n=1 Tax=Haliotis rubra TaxID=36100 RepID=UPI001EE503FE|nr:caspase-3-like [Haliotis rubra]